MRSIVGDADWVEVANEVVDAGTVAEGEGAAESLVGTASFFVRKA